MIRRFELLGTQFRDFDESRRARLRHETGIERGILRNNDGRGRLCSR
jgi:hypothetical protein